MLKRVFIVLLITVPSIFVMAQNKGDKLIPISSFKTYKASVIKTADKKMIELKSQIPSIQYDLKYAGKNNFMKRRMYKAGTQQTFIRKQAALALGNVQKELNEKELGLKVFDAYRPYSVSKKFWELVKDERYVANPSRGSNHNRGTAIDLTIIDLKTGKELDMGTGFDNFTDTAHHSFTRLSQQVLNNRRSLKSIMEKHGFKALDTEWWHYSFESNIKFEVLDIPFKKLNRHL